MVFLKLGFYLDFEAVAKIKHFVFKTNYFKLFFNYFKLNFSVEFLNLKQKQ